MNGFANAILSLLLGWLRSLFDAMWTLFGRDRGGILRFLQSNWLMVFLVLCIGGFVVDRLIYLIRWRPYYVWYARRERRRHMAAQTRHAPGQSRRARPQQDTLADAYPYEAQDALQDYAYADEPEPYQGYAPLQPMDEATYRYPRQTAPGTNRYPGVGIPPNGYAPVYAPEPDPVYPPAYGAAQPDMPRDNPAAYRLDDRYAPTASYAPIAHTPVELDPLSDELRFDEDFAPWAAPGDPYEDLPAERDLAYGIDPSFGAAKPEPIHSREDLQPAYAPQREPVHRHAPQPQAAPAVSSEPVHPGLDLETFQQNIGIPDPASLAASERRDQYADFAPYPVSSRGDQPGAKPKGIGALAQKARTLISGDDERNPRSIHDLQSTVDMKNAFHAPVYPKKRPESEEE
ncbi:MAG: hypothetical protein VB087_05070 [Candidatus Limiplasma sp.]|nr:hypothetical protein [Candidatus Limiplasma sp.]